MFSFLSVACSLINTFQTFTELPSEQHIEEFAVMVCLVWLVEVTILFIEAIEVQCVWYNCKNE